MNMQDKVSQFLNSGQNNEAIAFLDRQIKNTPENDELYYLLGKVYHKQHDWKNAIENYQHAVYLNSSSPAREVLELVNDILMFYNKDIYGQ